MAELTVGLGERSYPIVIQKGSLSRIGDDLKKRAIGNRYCVVADDHVAKLYGGVLLKSLTDAGLKAEILTFPRGEANKNLATVGDLASRLARLGFDRKDAIIAFGGGVSGDIAGFLASSYMRGIPFVQIPTTLLAQVDSSVGGKTGVDIPEGKNLIGAFYQPKAVYIDIDVLKTLPEEELLGGIGEVIKYGVIRDPEFFEFLRLKREAILQLDSDSIKQLIYTCCKIKAEVVSEDEREGGVRRILNYGHTIGHAVEAASDFTIIHGLAVSIGMVAAANLSVLSGLMTEAEAQQIVAILRDYNMPVTVPRELDRKRIKQYLLTDKKTVAGMVFFVLPTTIGDTVITDKVTEEQIDTVL
ncbi:MAG: 3-dehydroquinate synthase [Desulforhopalus sp.]|jgi:3-dehydroquinate synthase